MNNSSSITYDYVTQKSRNFTSPNGGKNIRHAYVTNKKTEANNSIGGEKINYDYVMNEITNTSSTIGENNASYEYVTNKNACTTFPLEDSKISYDYVTNKDTSTSLSTGDNKVRYDYVMNKETSTIVPNGNNNISYEYVTAKNTSTNLPTRNIKLGYDYVISNNMNNIVLNGDNHADVADIYLTNSTSKYEQLKTRSFGLNDNDNDKNNFYQFIVMPVENCYATIDSTDKSLEKTTLAGNSAVSKDGTYTIYEEINKHLNIGTIGRKTNCHTTEYATYDRYAVLHQNNCYENK